MVKYNSSTLLGWQAVILALAVVLCGLLEPAYCQMDGTALLLQQSPIQGGKITPEVGIHHFELDEEITLTAVPNPGYQFAYWIGDVSDPTVNSTIVYLDAPKIVIAVFERAEYEFLAPGGRIPGGPGRTLLFTSAADYSRAGGGGGIRVKRWRRPEPPPEEKPPTDFPVPEEANDFPVPEPIPEPATVCLLAMGGLALLRRKHRA